MPADNELSHSLLARMEVILRGGLPVQVRRAGLAVGKEDEPVFRVRRLGTNFYSAAVLVREDGPTAEHASPIYLVAGTDGPWHMVAAWLNRHGVPASTTTPRAL